MSRTLLVGLAIVGTVAVIVLVLASGGEDPQTGPADALSDMVVGEGPSAPLDPTLVDIAEASVKETNGDVVFEVTMAKNVPSKGSEDVLSFRWELSEGGRNTWLVNADVSGRPVAALTSQTSNFGVSTIDDTLPGAISVEGRSIELTIQAGDIKDFPTDFTWVLTSTLDADRADPASSLATDTAPDSGPGKVG